MRPFQISPLESADLPAVEALLDLVFGRDRRAKSSYRLRAGNPPCPAFAFAARMDARLVGSVQQTPVAVGEADAPALLLGPLAVLPALRGRGIGRALLRRSLDAARAAGRSHVFLVGDRAYYEPLGFGPAGRLGVSLPGEPADRVHHMALGPAGPAPQGELRPWRPQRRGAAGLAAADGGCHIPHAPGNRGGGTMDGAGGGLGG